jgi:CRP-like cAMP-binding protein
VRPEDLRARLEASRLFQGLAGQEALNELADRCEGIGAPAGDVIVAEDSEGDAMYVIGQGRVRVEKKTLYGDEYTVRFLEAGDFFGEVALLTRERRSATCRAETDCELIVLSRDRFRDFSERHPAAALAVTRTIAADLAQRLRAANQDIVTLFSALVHEVEGTLLG